MILQTLGPTRVILARIRLGASLRRPLSAKQHQQQRSFQDATLQWASENRTLAQACLEIPSATPTTPCPLPFASLEDYLTWRQWELPLQDNPNATALVSHVLSAPLTAANQLLPTFDPGRRNTNMNWCCIGARAEASLPVEYWREILVCWAAFLLSYNNKGRNNKLQLTIDFVGPDVLRRPPVHLSYQGHALSLRWLYNGTFHEYLQRTQDPNSVAEDMVLVEQHNPWSAYILFNPGLGHDNLRSSWGPTLQLLLSGGSTMGLTGRTSRILWTAHSATDVARDTDLLSTYLLHEAPLYRPNPFGSRIQYQDPLAKDHFVRPNQYAWTLEWP